MLNINDNKRYLRWQWCLNTLKIEISICLRLVITTTIIYSTVINNNNNNNKITKNNSKRLLGCWKGLGIGIENSTTVKVEKTWMVNINVNKRYLRWRCCLDILKIEISSCLRLITTTIIYWTVMYSNNNSNSNNLEQ